MAKKKKYVVILGYKFAAPSRSAIFKILRSADFKNTYVMVSLCILLGTTVFWGITGARIHHSNADQLVNAYLFENIKTFHGSILPGQHTFLLKWPLWLTLKLFGFSSGAFSFLTVFVALSTVGSLAYIIHRIEKRRLVFGTLCLALAATLLLIPAQPYAGAMLPVSMAMLTTRNLEYILYIGALILLIRAQGRKKSEILLSVLCFALLFASDKLFVTLSIGGALLLIVVFAIRRKWFWVRMGASWLVTSIVAAALATVVLKLLNVNGIVHIANTASNGPYGLIHSLKDLVLGTFYAVLGLFTNFGANPAFDGTTLASIPVLIFHRIFSSTGVAFIVNILILVSGLLACYRLVCTVCKTRKGKTKLPDHAEQLSILLIASTIVSFAVFIISKHYYQVDSRYLSISFFAVFIAGTTYARQLKLNALKIDIIGLVLAVGIVFGLSAHTHIYLAERSVIDPYRERSELIAEILKSRPVDTLVGDYWRVVPAKLESRGQLHITPMSDCTTRRDVLSSKEWQADLAKHSFAYLLSLDGGLTDYPKCNLEQVIAKYGRPNASFVIAGSVAKPKEQLLFYEHGANKSAPAVLLKKPSTIVPLELNELPNTSCSTSTVMNIVAHQDDDLLFINPDTLHSIRAGNCVRTVYVTAGDAGSGKVYWLNRERGSELAYSNMLGSSEIWVQRTVHLSEKSYITVVNPRGNQKVSLIFMRLPDGNLKGQGFRASDYDSLARLFGSNINIAHTVDGQSEYTSKQLTDGLLSIMNAYKPSEIRTQSTGSGGAFPDHSDHRTVGEYTQTAYDFYRQKQLSTIKHYLGYTGHSLPENVFGKDYYDKEAAFVTYTQYDDRVCRSVMQCRHDQAYGAYLPRQHTSGN